MAPPEGEMEVRSYKAWVRFVHVGCQGQALVYRDEMSRDWRISDNILLNTAQLFQYISALRHRQRHQHRHQRNVCKENAPKSHVRFSLSGACTAFQLNSPRRAPQQRYRYAARSIHASEGENGKFHTTRSQRVRCTAPLTSQDV